MQRFTAHELELLDPAPGHLADKPDAHVARTDLAEKADGKNSKHAG